MTQFILLHCESTVRLDHELIVVTEDDCFLYAAAKAIFGRDAVGKVWSVALKATDFDGVFTEARRQLNSGFPFETTAVYRLLRSLVKPGVSVALWYGSEYTDLDEVRDLTSLLDAVKAGVMSPSVECYVRLAQ